MEKMRQMKLPFQGVDYPDLKIIHEFTTVVLNKYYADLFEQEDAAMIQYEPVLFMQRWSNTACGFDWESGCSGQGFTDEYTTVMKVTWAKRAYNYIIGSEQVIYVVFFGERCAYCALNPTEEFYMDLDRRCMESQSRAVNRYGYGNNVRVITLNDWRKLN